MKKNRNILGIYNYCNSWCERCPFTQRCAVFADMEAEHLGEDRPGRTDGENEAFWEDLETTSEADHALIDAMNDAAEEALEPIEMARFQAEQDSIRERVRRHPVDIAAREYLNRSREWLEQAAEWFKDRDRDADVDDCVDVIGWYHMQIHVKLARALHGAIEGVPEILADMPRDSDGSAKVALIGMDHSIAAWSRLNRHCPEREDEIREFMIALERLRRATERAFPAARSFVRPGFDESNSS